MATTARSLINSELTFVRDNDTVLDAAKRLAREGIGAMPICRDDKSLHGMITDRDIVVKVVAGGRDPASVRVGELAQGRPVTVDAEAPIEEAARIMGEHKVRRLPVMERGALIGVLSQADLARALPPDESGKLLERISEA
jgi:CBS domain-containing protein